MVNDIWFNKILIFCAKQDCFAMLLCTFLNLYVEISGFFLSSIERIIVMTSVTFK
ncbi:hypothetical protein NT01EI_2064 [Edwardsiella ictaluri 93-146]|uniref:Uncharacterized protein n=1 Tax=Edwardsiella ictaluri (strain 93-146) TaxID=634503 RepID=C5BDC3_EDWI9|nr:hypothetical protein NT01EI_2064 [Edwardsiella ictaluri 93-146]